MSTVPIPQGATIEQAAAPAATSVPIPQNAIVEQQPGKGVTTDSMDADYQFKNPALTSQEMEQLKQANDARPLRLKLLGLPPDDPIGAALTAKDQAHQTESAQHSSYVQQQLKDKAVGGAVVAAAPAAMPATVAAAGPAAAIIRTVGPPVVRAIPTIVRIAKSPITRDIIGSVKDLGLVGKILGWF